MAGPLPVVSGPKALVSPCRDSMRNVLEQGGGNGDISYPDGQCPTVGGDMGSGARFVFESETEALRD